MRDKILFTLDELAKQSNQGEKQTSTSGSIIETITAFILPTVTQFLQTQSELGVHGEELVTLINNEFGLALTLDHLQHGTDK